MEKPIVLQYWTRRPHTPSEAQLESPADYPFPDQDLLNEVFAARWKSLGYGYNALKTLSFAHSPIWNEQLSISPLAFNKDDPEVITTSPGGSVMPVLNIHYILEKPWNMPNLQESNRFVGLYQWWLAHSELHNNAKIKNIDPR
ncbi:hypothetical protein BGZ65_006295 [Modicella reniformis]|uniref:Uncharacterized protein n=1 Tax=Modicella reniformis TaxID=1440133 RepID=A0A9P6MKV7_9FUNG|nr:hypothetical protein BGZ65_006295 [Modicella reniformis]